MRLLSIRRIKVSSPFIYAALSRAYRNSLFINMLLLSQIKFYSLSISCVKKGQKLQFPTLELLFYSSIPARRLLKYTLFSHTICDQKEFKSFQAYSSSLLRLRHRMVTANVSQTNTLDIKGRGQDRVQNESYKTDRTSKSASKSVYSQSLEVC